MSVIRCELLDEGRTVTQDERGRYSYGAVYRITTDDKDDDAITAEIGAYTAGPDPLPEHMSTYALGGSTDVSAFRQSLQGTQGNGAYRKHWDFAVGWMPLPPGKSPLETQTSFQSPLLRPERHWVEFQTITETIETDRDNNPIVNSAGQPFDESAVEDNEYEVLIWEKNFATAGELRALNRTYRRTLNDATFAGYPAEHCKCLPILTQRPQFENGTTYYRATFRIVCADRPWRREFVNRGNKHFKDVTPEGGGDPVKTLTHARDPVLDDDGEVTEYVIPSEPVLLTDGTETDSPGAGYRLSEHYPDALGNALEFATRGLANFSLLPITPPT
ncbi:MAG: hypothetical protein AAGF31_00480 [Planctomycetota bacterium]